jgi:hypothetical protein
MKTFWSSAVLVGFLTTLPAFADVSTESADELFARARALIKVGDCAGALPLLERSHTLEPALGTRFNLGICSSRVGRLTEAAEHLRSVIRAFPASDERRAHAERALQDLLPRIPKLIVEIDESRQRMKTVRLDGLPVDLEPNRLFAINPGQHEVEVVLFDHSPEVRRFSVDERETYRLLLGGLAPEAEKSVPVGVNDVNDGAFVGGGEPSFAWTRRRIAAVVAGGTSIVAFGVATGFALSARSVYASSAPHCSPDGACDAEGVEKRERAHDRGDIATVALTVGVASALAAGTLWLTGAPVSPSASPARVGFGLRGWAGRVNGGQVFVSSKY